jgi:hypothetical protein
VTRYGDRQKDFEHGRAYEGVKEKNMVTGVFLAPGNLWDVIRQNC